jgi:hypothetical protein
MDSVKGKIKILALKYRDELSKQMENRVDE